MHIKFFLALAVAAGCTARTLSPTPINAPSQPNPAALPALIAHRGGLADYPENTLPAIQGALANHSDAIWLSVQLSRDGVPVLYRPQDLSALTDARGPVSSKSVAELAQINAGWQFKPATQAQKGKGKEEQNWPYRAHPVGIPTLSQALHAIPRDKRVILDMKALPASPQAQAVAHVLEAQNAWAHVMIYSTEAAYQAAFSAYPQARLFESRDATRQRVFGVALTGQCDTPAAGTRAGFELNRNIELVEHFTLGEGRSTFKARTWTPTSVQCFRRAPKTFLVAFAVNDQQAYYQAACLHMDAVLVDSPNTMHAIRAAIHLPLKCAATQNLSE